MSESGCCEQHGRCQTENTATAKILVTGNVLSLQITNMHC